MNRSIECSLIYHAVICGFNVKKTVKETGRTRVQILRTHVKPDLTVHTCNSSTPMERWKSETGDSLQACVPAGLVHTEVNKKPCHKQSGARPTNTWTCPLSSSEAARHTCAHAQTHERAHTCTKSIQTPKETFFLRKGFSM